MAGYGAMKRHGAVAEKTLRHGKDMNSGLMVKIPNPGVPRSKPLDGSNFSSAFHPSEVKQMSTRDFWELSGKK